MFEVAELEDYDESSKVWSTRTTKIGASCGFMWSSSHDIILELPKCYPKKYIEMLVWSGVADGFPQLSWHFPMPGTCCPGHVHAAQSIDGSPRRSEGGDLRNSCAAARSGWLLHQDVPIFGEVHVVITVYDMDWYGIWWCILFMTYMTSRCELCHDTLWCDVVWCGVILSFNHGTGYED